MRFKDYTIIKCYEIEHDGDLYHLRYTYGTEDNYADLADETIYKVDKDGETMTEIMHATLDGKKVVDEMTSSKAIKMLKIALEILGNVNKEYTEEKK